MIKAMRPAFGAGALAFIVFALSGCAGLIYQSIWTQYLGLFLGEHAPRGAQPGYHCRIGLHEQSTLSVVPWGLKRLTA